MPVNRYTSGPAHCDRLSIGRVIYGHVGASHGGQPLVRTYIESGGRVSMEEILPHFLSVYLSGSKRQLGRGTWRWLSNWAATFCPWVTCFLHPYRGHCAKFGEAGWYDMQLLQCSSAEIELVSWRRHVCHHLCRVGFSILILSSHSEELSAYDCDLLSVCSSHPSTHLDKVRFPEAHAPQDLKAHEAWLGSCIRHTLYYCTLGDGGWFLDCAVGGFINGSL